MFWFWYYSWCIILNLTLCYCLVVLFIDLDTHHCDIMVTLGKVPLMNKTLLVADFFFFFGSNIVQFFVFPLNQKIYFFSYCDTLIFVLLCLVFSWVCIVTEIILDYSYAYGFICMLCFWFNFIFYWTKP